DGGLDHRVGHRPRVRGDGGSRALVSAAAVTRQVHGHHAVAVLLQPSRQRLPAPRSVTHAVHEHELSSHACPPARDIIARRGTLGVNRLPCSIPTFSPPTTGPAASAP